MMHWARARKAPFTPQGIAKSGTQGLSSGVWAKVTGWLAHSLYPATVITSDGITIPAGVTCTINARVTFGGSASENQCRIRVDGVLVASSGVGTTAVQASYVLPAAGTAQLVTLNAVSNGLTGTRVVQSGEANTYLTATA